MAASKAVFLTDQSPYMLYTVVSGRTAFRLHAIILGDFADDLKHFMFQTWKYEIVKIEIRFGNV